MRAGCMAAGNDNASFNKAGRQLVNRS